eukprot:14928289-Alexandrium_andersonii.AAC.1
MVPSVRRLGLREVPPRRRRLRAGGTRPRRSSSRPSPKRPSTGRWSPACARSWRCWAIVLRMP